MGGELELRVETPEGLGRFVVDLPTRTPVATLVLGHGAGGGIGARDLALLARRLPAVGVTVARFEQPWRTAGGRVAVRPPRLDVAWLAAVPQLVAQPWSASPLVTGGRSAGARVACRTAEALDAAAVVCLAFPLHLPGRPERSRVEELAAPRVPRLVLQGSRDPFGTPEEIRAELGPRAAEVQVVDLPGADHGFRLPKGSPLTPSGLDARVVAAVAALVDALTSAPPRE